MTAEHLWIYLTGEPYPKESADDLVVLPGCEAALSAQIEESRLAEWRLMKKEEAAR